MPSIFKIVLLTILASLIGIIAYLGYLYFSELKRIDNVAVEGKTSSKSVVLEGEILSGSSFDALPAECLNQYFLTLGDKRIWLTSKDGSNKEWSLEFSKYESYGVVVTGKVGIRSWPCSEDFIVVEKIEVQQENKIK